MHESRALLVGLATSLILHLAVILLYSSGSEIVGRAPGAREPTPVDRTAAGSELIALVEVPELEEPPADEPERLPTPEEEPEPLRTLAAGAPADTAVTVAAAGGETDVPDEGDLSVAERLQPRMADPRLWAGVDRHFSELSDFELADLLLRGMVRSWNDSLAVAEALANRARDWTYTDSEGRRWGLASGRLYLGDFSVPLPFSFQVSPERRQEWSERQWVTQDLLRGAGAAAIQEEWVERARMMRERLEVERDAASGSGRDGGDGG